MEPEYLFSVEPEKFYPAPKVTSAVVRCVRREKPPVETENEELLFHLMRGAFALRRKTLANSLASALGRPKGELQDAIRTAGLPDTVRGEQLTFADFAALCKILKA
jgi:16S rRNA (adenine1518-N6/adenine1519-N6)-dimethyltransferase